MAMMKLFIASLLLVGTNAFELTPTNVDDAVAGKTVFIKFLAPWYGASPVRPSGLDHA